MGLLCSSASWLVERNWRRCNMTMMLSLRNRIFRYAQANRHKVMWKRRLHALYYGAGIRVLAKIK